MNGYCRRQHGPLYLVILAAAAALLVGAWFMRHSVPAALAMLALAAVVALLALSFVHLTVRDEGDHLAVRFGPLPLLGTRIAYREIKHVEQGRSTVIDGWGVHWVLGRGWIFNLWGFDCVVIRTDRRTVRVGTDDPQGLTDFIRSRCGR